MCTFGRVCKKRKSSHNFYHLEWYVPTTFHIFPHSTKKAGRIGNWLSCGSEGKKANIACSREEYQVNVPVKLFFNQTENWLGDKASFTFNIEDDSLLL